MATISKTCGDRLKRLGLRLQQERLRRGQSMVQFSEALGISTTALRSMESGRPGVSVGQWAEVLRHLKRLGELDMLLSGPGPQSPYVHQTHPRCLRHRSSRPVL